jgi:hypothetical protein
MLISEMEAVLKSLDQRVGRIEQVLPTLATKEQLRDEVRGVRVLVEDVRGDIRLVHERIDVETAGVNRRFDDVEQQLVDLQRQLGEVLRRLDPR